MGRLLMKLSLWFAIVLIQTYGYKGCLEKERIGLLEFKSFIKSVNLYDKEEIFISWVDDKTSDCCGWERVKCNAATGRVIELSLNSSVQFNKFGYLTLNLSLFHPFDELLILDLSSNFFQDCQENKVYDGFRSLKRLKFLDLAFNFFNASLLPCLNTLTSLTTLNLGSNSMGEGLTLAKKGLANLTNLKTLYLRHNLVSQGFTNLTGLEVLDLGENEINGCPSSLGLANLTNLKTLYLDYSQINCSLASQGFANLKSLEILDLGFNGINGSLSSSGICELKNLVEVDLRRNNFDGQLPKCLTNLTYLKVLVLSSNQLNGYLPPSIGDMKSLEYLDLRENNFEGLFSLSSLANQSKLEEVYLLGSTNIQVYVYFFWQAMTYDIIFPINYVD
ncbi:hypothetical protein Pint_03194 [Pistacia integerrima]|uniref:Uncharacterized protein n=1 Tax=Pistacia integerrima TaxID=434235 RepID=A0ACC0ZIG9_9ROSI|nr:hypothetical protein Pint_03194 [Pistacia integerrima]